MKKLIVLALAMALAVSLTSCGVKEAVQGKTRELLSGGNQGVTDSLESEKSHNGEGSYNSGRRPIASVDNPGGFWQRIEDQWLNEPEQGYVWTITIDDAEVIDMMGLVQVNYKMQLSCSHVGYDMFGAYRGEMSMEYAADMDNLGELLTLTGGSMDYDADGWFKNENFLMLLEPFSQKDKEIWVEIYGKLPEAEDPIAQAILEQYLGAVFEDVGSGEQDFEKNNSPAGHWFDLDFRMTEGDMSGFLQLTNIAYGTTSGGGTVDASGKNTQGSAVVSHPLVGTFQERYEEVIETPMPYTLEVYDAGQVVFTLYSANGGPVTVKLYGTIDKIPVEETTLIRR